MGEDPLPRLKKYSISLGKFGRNKKRNILVIIILVVIAGLFFSVFFEKNALAAKIVFAVTPSADVMDPMKRVGQGFQEKLENQKENRQLCEISDKKESVKSEADSSEEGYRNILSGHPMEEMASAIAKQDRPVAAFLIGIGKKESDWGTHSPKKDGHECFNFWGYKGGYNVTEGGYSCFDSPEQAVAVVGGRIEELIGKNIDTPARMVVWKCGNASCNGHDPVAVKKWISDVSAYYHLAES
ncbi:MAG: hypothetical protein WC022_00375 [Parcubacteria group bacterium]